MYFCDRKVTEEIFFVLFQQIAALFVKVARYINRTSSLMNLISYLWHVTVLLIRLYHQLNFFFSSVHQFVSTSSGRVINCRATEWIHPSQRGPTIPGARTILWKETFWVFNVCKRGKQNKPYNCEDN